MVSISDFFRIPKIDSCKHLCMGMRYSDYIKWAGFHIPNYSDFGVKNAGSENNLLLRKEVFDYTQNRIGIARDLFLLYCHSVSESVCENVKSLNGTVNAALVSKCKNPTEFVDIVKSVSEKYKEQIQFHPFLGVYTDSEANIPLAIMLLESGLFEGIELFGKSLAENPEKFLGIFKAARRLNLKSRISCLGFRSLKGRDEILELIANFQPTNLLNPNITYKNSQLESFKDGKIFQDAVKIAKDNNIHIDFSPAPIYSGTRSEEKAFVIREFAESGIPISLCTEDLLFLNRSISEFAVDLCKLGVFCKEELVDIISDTPSTT